MPTHPHYRLEFLLCAVNVAIAADSAPHMETNTTTTLMPATQQSATPAVAEQIHRPAAVVVDGSNNNNGNPAVNDTSSSTACQAGSVAPPPVPSATGEQGEQQPIAGPSNTSPSHCQEQSQNGNEPIPAADPRPVNTTPRPITESPTKLPRTPLPDAPRRSTDPVLPSPSSSFVRKVINRDPDTIPGVPTLPPPPTSAPPQRQHWQPQKQTLQPQQQQQSNGIAGVTANGVANGAVNGVANGAVNGAANGAVNGATSGSANGNLIGLLNSKGQPFKESTIQELEAARRIRNEGQLQPEAQWCHNCVMVRDRQRRLGDKYNATDKENEFFNTPGGCIKMVRAANGRKQRETCALCTAKKECCQSVAQKAQRDAARAAGLSTAGRRRGNSNNHPPTVTAPGPVLAPAPAPAPAAVLAPAQAPRPAARRGGGKRKRPVPQ